LGNRCPDQDSNGAPAEQKLEAFHSSILSVTFILVVGAELVEVRPHSSGEIVVESEFCGYTNRFNDPAFCCENAVTK
jgi:hypothetical protein